MPTCVEELHVVYFLHSQRRGRDLRNESQVSIHEHFLIKKRRKNMRNYSNLNILNLVTSGFTHKTVEGPGEPLLLLLSFLPFWHLDQLV